MFFSIINVIFSLIVGALAGYVAGRLHLDRPQAGAVTIRNENARSFHWGASGVFCCAMRVDLGFV